MRTSNGQSNAPDHPETSSGARNVPLITKELSPAQEELIDLVIFFDPLELSGNLKLIHNLALYHTDQPIDEEEKYALYNVNALSEVLMKMSHEA
jgi:hypothetical protein